ncbi:MAG: ABC transporter substrate-binding protein, partial [Rhodospirillales bacterium]
SWVAFTLRANAKWHDGQPVTVEDVIWTVNTLREKGAPFYRFYYANVAKVEKTGPRSVKFTFQRTENRELPLIIGQLAVLPKHYWAERDFESTTLEPPLGSGPYRIESFEPGRSITYARVPDYWGARLPVNVGTNNFDTVRYDYYRDSTVAIEAFKSGAIDYRDENSSRHWATSYNIPAVRDGRIKKETLPHGRSTGMQGFAFNLRRPIFQDRLVRRALAYTFDFEWSNKTLFYGQYTRTRSFFQNSELAATGVPQGREREILAKYSRQLPPELFTTEYNPPRTDGTGNNRTQLRQALTILRQAGWDIDEETRKLTHKDTKREMKFEVLLVSPLFERVVLPMKKNLARLGIDITVRTVDSAQYQERLTGFDFDMVVMTWGQSLSPGNEQRNY